jgi:hypothetical protein
MGISSLCHRKIVTCGTHYYTHLTNRCHIPHYPQLTIARLTEKSPNEYSRQIATGSNAPPCGENDYLFAVLFDRVKQIAF